LEANSSPKGYSITNAKIPILITLKKTSDLKPHEETIPEELKKLVSALQDNPVLRHPIIADIQTGIVLDGTHRLAAVKQLKCNFIPSALVDYNDPQITIERWFRLFSGPNVSKFENGIRQLNLKEVNHDECENGLLQRRWYATIERPGFCGAFPRRKTTPYEMVRDSHEIELAARKEKVKTSYQDNKALDSKSRTNLVMSMIKISKSEVVETVSQGKLFPPKSTRHLVPSRPLGAGVPLEWLRGSDYFEAQLRYHEFVQSRKVRRLPEGSRIGSRRYQEEVFLFE
jgi:L-serine kinase (ADP)